MKPKHTYQPQRRDRIFLVALASFLMMLLTACGGSATSNTNPAASPTTAANTTAATTPTTITNTPPTNTATPTPKPKPLPGSTQVVSILTDSNGSFIFSPASLTITVGATVTWKNMSSAPHTITSDDGQTFDSGTIAPGGTYKFQFKSAGTFPYHCNYHPYMKATIAL